jgi:mRNA-degrading endonuclease toxin of MazEF toxin-antitoxin module
MKWIEPMQRGDVIWLDLNNPPPAVTGGHEQRNTRPFILVSLGDGDFGNSMLTVIPLTSKTGKARYPHTLTIQPSKQNGLQVESVLLVFQIVSYDKGRLINVVGSLEPEYMRQLDQKLRQLICL